VHRMQEVGDQTVLVRNLGDPPFSDPLWFTMVYYGLLWFTMVYYGLLWFTMVYWDRKLLVS